MDRNTIDVSDLALAGQARVAVLPDFPDTFVVRLQAGQPPPGSVQAGEGEYFMAFSRRCTHMGGILIDTGREHRQAAGLKREAVLRCPCHGTAYDLAAGGLVVTGPASCRLPQLELELVSENLVAARGWRRVPPAFGIPYGEAPE